MGIALLRRREGIIIYTVETLNEVGLQNLSTKLIAKCEGVSEGTLFRHFKNKTEIMIAVIDHFVSAYAEYYENYPAITSVV